MLLSAIVTEMPRISRALRRGDWLAVFRTLTRLGADEPDPEQYAWNAFRALEPAASCPALIPAAWCR